MKMMMVIWWLAQQLKLMLHWLKLLVSLLIMIWHNEYSHNLKTAIFIQMILQQTLINLILFITSNYSCMHKSTQTLICHLAKHASIFLHLTRKLQCIPLQLLHSFPQVTFLMLGVCIVSVSVQLIHGEKAHLSMIVSLWRLTQILQKCVVLTLLVFSFSSLSHITTSSILVHLYTGFHVSLDLQIAALKCG